MLDLLQIIPGRKKRTTKGWVSFNAICCHHRGHRPDKRSRGGIKSDGSSQTYHCFNCNFSTRFQLGKPISYKTRQLLKWAGVDDQEITKLSLESLKQKDLVDVYSPYYDTKIVFKGVNLPKSAIPLEEDNPNHVFYNRYLKSRGISAKDYTFYITPGDKGRNADRIIVPMMYKTKTIGFISRYVDNKSPKYIKENQSGALFGYDLQKPEYEVALVFEGVFDALKFNGCALMHDDISEEQALLLRNLNRKIIVVPDQDETGLQIAGRALELGFHVSIPDWGDDIKDANEALLKFGRMPTLLSIIQSATNSKIKIEMKRKKLAKRI
jgi:hypothetical protein